MAAKFWGPAHTQETSKWLPTAQLEKTQPNSDAPATSWKLVLLWELLWLPFMNLQEILSYYLVLSPCSGHLFSWINRSASVCLLIQKMEL